MTSMARLRRWSRRQSILLIAAVILTSCVAALFVPTSPPARAADQADFQPGNLISDANFLDSDSMTTADVQSFLNGKVPRCAGTNGMPCLKDYTAQSTPTLDANAYCKAMPGGPMTAAQIITSVSLACGISPRVILVMLQKEQGLITSTAPTPRNYSAALGQGCPDGAACDPNFAGFFHQIYGAARQFQIYLKFPKSFGYQLGWNNILYQATPPDNNRVCGTKRVYIENDATRALYVYTPYVPNDAALNNLYGTGDFCSTYGNRNFWRLYSDWFGNPRGIVVDGEYARAWNDLGGSSGVLGSPTSDVVCINGRYCQQSFTGGTVFWFPGRGVFGVPSVIESIWRSLGFIDGSAGMPLLTATCGGSGACAQSFDGGYIAADSSGGSLVGRHIEAAWVAAGGVSVGAARGPELCSADATQCAQQFGAGAFFARADSVLSVIGGHFSAWDAAGMSQGFLGYPVDNAVCDASGCSQAFTGGITVVRGSDYGSIPTAIANAYLANGGIGVIGVPSSAAACDSNGTCHQLFSRLRIDTGSSRPAIFTTDGFLDAWSSRGYEAGVLGAPTSGAVCSTVTCMQSFVGGALVGTRSAGIVAVLGEYRSAWFAAGGASGTLGLPTGGDSCNGRSCSQPFEGGALVWTPSNGVVAVSGWFVAPWNSRGGEAGVLGAPTSGAVCSTVTCMQSFVGGALVGTRSAGIVAVLGEYRSAWFAAGGASGTLGLPTGGDSCNGRSCSQPFEGGALVWTPSNGVHAVVQPIFAQWQAAGGASGRYGAPVAEMTTSANMITQPFQGGVLSSMR